MITFNELCDMMVAADDEMKRRIAAKEDGASEMYRCKEKAAHFAGWMASKDLNSHIGIDNFCTINLKRGDVVRLRKGAHVRSTHPQYRGKGYTNPKDRNVVVFDFDAGWLPTHGPQDPREPTITWVGTGGYWFYAKAADLVF